MLPLLENPGMVIHPPILFLGYAGYAVPFAFARIPDERYTVQRVTQATTCLRSD